MEEAEALARAVEELHEPERLAGLLLDHLRAMDAPVAVVEPFERGQAAMLEWLNA